MERCDVMCDESFFRVAGDLQVMLQPVGEFRVDAFALVGGLDVQR